MSVRGKLVELAYIRWEIRERAAAAKEAPEPARVSGSPAGATPGAFAPARAPRLAMMQSAPLPGRAAQLGS
jgi:hypothetical protein